MIVFFPSKVTTREFGKTVLYHSSKLLNMDPCHVNVLRLQALERRCEWSVVMDSVSGSYLLSILFISALIERCMAQV